jgi:hypothetical protein
MRLGLENPYHRFNSHLALNHPFISTNDLSIDDLPPLFSEEETKKAAELLRKNLKVAM